jgi:hypothetical protein
MRIILAYTLGNRDATTNKDARILNGFVESDENMVRAIKRPGLNSSYSVTTGSGATSTSGQALFAITTPSAPGIAGTAMLFAVRGDVITRGI